MNDSTVFATTIGQFLQDNAWVLVGIIAWSTFWKAIALWKSARNNEKVWFVTFMVVNTLGLLEILYIFYFAKQKGLPATLSPKTAPQKK